MKERKEGVGEMSKGGEKLQSEEREVEAKRSR